mmetsp:Transcript_13414/g.34214  ORF Transcript_13414/g.34214 Transcript_13414/m.34214 type:complete len:256 (+) Transcript_13414:1798-2565(+)
MTMMSLLSTRSSTSSDSSSEYSSSSRSRLTWRRAAALPPPPAPPLPPPVEADRDVDPPPLISSSISNMPNSSSFSSLVFVFFSVFFLEERLWATDHPSDCGSFTCTLAAGAPLALPCVFATPVMGVDAGAGGCAGELDGDLETSLSTLRWPSLAFPPDAAALSGLCCSSSSPSLPGCPSPSRCGNSQMAQSLRRRIISSCTSTTLDPFRHSVMVLRSVHSERTRLNPATSVMGTQPSDPMRMRRKMSRGRLSVLK